MNKISFHNDMHRVFSILSEQEVRDSVDAFFRFGPDSFIFYGKTSGTEYGTHVFDPLSRSHEIHIDPNKIAKAFKIKGRVGGNTSAPSMKAALLMVLCHELTHANQHHTHASHAGKIDAKFYGLTAAGKVIPFKTYMGRPCEVEARRTVDENMHVIRAMSGLPDLKDRSEKDVDEDAELYSVAESFYDLETVQVGDIVDELRLSKLNNAINVEKIIGFLQGNGVEVI